MSDKIQTKEEIEKLKANWLEDPCWDIEHTEGFEAHYEELKKFHQDTDAERERDIKAELVSEAAKLGVSPEALQESRNLEYASDSKSTAAKRSLKHYFGMAGVSFSDSDCGVEIDGIVDDIIDAAVAKAAAVLLLKKEGKQGE